VKRKSERVASIASGYVRSTQQVRIALSFIYYAEAKSPMVVDRSIIFILMTRPYANVIGLMI
jgi:pyridoxal/pyridoxine/pyridoxamine kinase